MRHFYLLLLSLVIAVALTRPTSAAVLILASGARLDGQLINSEENPRKFYQFKMTNGTEVSVAPEQVREFRADRPEVIEYGKIRDNYPDTVKGQFDLAIW